MRAALVAIALAACQGRTAPAASPPAIAPARPVDAATPPPPDAARRIVGALAAPSRPDRVWPSRVCLDGGALVFEHDCGCNDRLLCDVGVSGATIAVTLRLDPDRRPMCDDCFPMVPARCVLPAFAGASAQVVIDGAPAFVLPRDAPDGACWAARDH